MKLSFTLCLAICIVGVYCADDKVPAIAKKLNDNAHIKECVDESKVDQKTFDDMKQNYKLPEVPELKCFLGCMMKKSGVLNADGTFTDKYTGDADCKAKGGKGLCEVGYNTAKCLLEKDLASLKTSR